MLLRLAVTIAFALTTHAAAMAQAVYPYRGVLTSPGGDLPFVMTTVGDGCPVGIEHGDHRRNVNLARTSTPPPIVVELPPYDSWLEYVAMENTYRGTWTKVGPRGEATMPFRWEPWPMYVDPTAPQRRLYGPLFALPGEPWDPTGRWTVQFAKDTHPAVAIFEASRGQYTQMPGEIQGTFLTVTGDYGYLAGTARGDELRLACFDGAHAFLFVARRKEDGSLTGDFWSGTNWHETWVARRSDTAALPDAFSLTKAREGIALADLKYGSVGDGRVEDGTMTRIGDLMGTCTLVVLFGSWCPNCGDAGPFLRDLQQRFGDRGLRIVGLAFEHGSDNERHRYSLNAYRQQHDVRWPILLAGSSDKAAASAAFPAIDAVRAFPTTLFVDDTGKIRIAHQGFAGPATGEAHAEQRRAFEATIERLLAEAESRPKVR